MRILQVLTLLGINGEYGGPSQVSLDQSEAISKFGHEIEILAGATGQDYRKKSGNVKINLVNSKSLVEKYGISSLWSWKFLRIATSKIKSAEVIHIHFARDLIPIVSAIICLALKKPFFLQTHGMIKRDEKFIALLLDKLVVIFILKRAKTCFVLTETEKAQILDLCESINVFVLQNGISNQKIKDHNSEFSRIIFCSRLHKRKQVQLFLELAEYRLSLGNKETFQIYGPDFGDLSLVEEFLQKSKFAESVEYKGALPQERVLEKLRNSDLLVLPSQNEPYPLVVLQAISVGTPVLVMPSCGLSALFMSSFPEFVAEEENISGLIKNFEKIKVKASNLEYPELIATFSREKFSITKVAENLILKYEECLVND